MSRATLLVGAGAGALAGAVQAAQAPGLLAGVEGGLWELEGLPGKKNAVKQCIANPLKLAAIEHGSAKCTETLLNESGSTVRVSVQCHGGDFGQASIKVITEKSLRVDVQGISGGAPYAYVVQARHAGPCGTSAGKLERGGH